MAKRQLIRIDGSLCDGCGLCVPACAEGAIQIVDGQAKLVRDEYCDGLGACLGHCPRGAISIEDVEAPAFDPKAVERHLARRQAPSVSIGGFGTEPGASGGGCPGSRSVAFSAAAPATQGASTSSELHHWPVQLHLISPHATQYQEADLLLCADCVPFAMPDLHAAELAGRSLAIACPKLDQGQQAYLDKLAALIDDARIRSLRVLVMEVPCCSGLLALARRAVELAERSVPVSYQVISVRGERLTTGAA